MSIETEITRIRQGVNNVKTAITTKGGTVPSGAKIDNLAEAVASIPSGGGSEEKDVNFYDYDGTFITGYSHDELASLSELPQLPSHPEKDIIATGWTSTLNQVKAVTSPNKLDVGAVYSPKVNGVASDATVFVIRPEKEVAFSMTFSQSVSNGVTVDWGDGSAVESKDRTGVVTFGHAYTDTTPETKITITPAAGCNLILGYNGTSSLSMFGGNPQISRASIGRAEIGMYAFTGLSTLKELTISSKVTSIGYVAFRNCYALTSVVIPNSITSIGSNIFEGCCSLTSVVIPSSVTSIGTQAFCNCCALASVVIPNSVTSIGNSAFYWCYTLASVSIPNSVTSIGNSTFNSCLALTSVVIPNSVTSIGNNAFNACSGLTSMIIPASVTGIEAYTFGGCSALASVVIPNSITSIADNVFRGCFSLTSVVIPGSVTTVGEQLFPNCHALTDIKFGDRTSMPTSTWLSSGNRFKVFDFTDCKQVPTMSSASFLTNLQSYTNIVVPDDLYDSWIVATNWSTKAGQIVKQSDYYGA